MFEKRSVPGGQTDDILSGGYVWGDVKRRDVLGSLALATTTSGCMGLLATKCEPGEDELGAVRDDVDPDRNVDVSIRGVVVKLVDGFVVVSDGTGLAEIAPPGLGRFDEDRFQRGDCVAAEGPLDGEYSWQSGRIRIKLSSRDDIESVGDAKRDPPTIPDEPDASFEVDSRSDDGVAVVTHAEGESIPARHLEVRRFHDETISTYSWHELTEKAPDDEVSVGDSLQFEKSGISALTWRYNEYWVKKMSTSWSL